MVTTFLHTVDWKTVLLPQQNMDASKIRFMAGAIVGLFLSVVLIMPISAKDGNRHLHQADVGYFAPGYRMVYTLNGANDTGASQGEIWNYTPTGDWYHGSVVCSVVRGTSVYFAAYFQEATVPAWGPYVVVKADSDSAGTIQSQFLSSHDVIDWCGMPQDPTGDPWQVYRGNELLGV